MNCAQIQNQLIDYIEGGLSITDCERVEGHLADCGVCQKEEQATRQILAMLKRQTLPAPDEAYWQQFSKRVQRQCKKEQPANLVQRLWEGVKSLWTPVFSTPAFGVSLSILLLMGALFLMTTRQKDEKTLPGLTEIVFASNLTPEAAELILSLGDDPYDVVSDSSLDIDGELEIDILL